MSELSRFFNLNVVDTCLALTTLQEKKHRHYSGHNLGKAKLNS